MANQNLIVFFVAGTIAAISQTWGNSWTGIAGDGDWFTGGNWSANHYPAGGEDAILSGGSPVVLLTNTTADLSSFTIGSATLICSNWDTQIRATTVLIQNGGILTLPAAFTSHRYRCAPSGPGRPRSG